MHTGEKPHKCNVCVVRPLLNFLQLWGHERIHTGRKNHTNVMCGKRFTPNACFQTSENSYRRKFKCKDCDMFFYPTLPNFFGVTQRLTLERNPYKCIECRKASASFQSSYLTQHKTIHTGRETYKCHECGKAENFNLQALLGIKKAY